MTDKMLEKMEGTFIREDLVIRKDDPVLGGLICMMQWAVDKDANYNAEELRGMCGQALAQLQKLRGAK